MNKPAQLSLEIFALLILTLIAAGSINPARAQQTTQPAAAPAAVVKTPIATPAPTPESMTLTSETDSTIKLTATPIRVGDDDSLRLKPGEKKQITLKVYNTSKMPVKIMSLAEDFVIGEDGATPQPVETNDQNNRWSLKNWITIVPNSQTIKAGETGAVGVVIEVPKDALPGGHYAMVLHLPDVRKNVVGSTSKDTAISQRVGTLIYVVVDGPVMEEAFIRDLKIPQFQEFGPVPYSFIIDNNSDVHLKPKLTFNVYNIWGKRIYSEAIDSMNIFPKDSRAFKNGLWNQIWGFGRYKGEIVAIYGSQSSTKIVGAFFWLFPLKLVLGIGVIIMTLIGMGVAIRRHLIHRSQDQSKRVRELEETVARMEKEKTTPPTVE